jgi:hypothetical protein
MSPLISYSTRDNRDTNRMSKHVHSQDARPPGRQLNAWELSRLLEPVHQWRRQRAKATIERPHFKPILGFIYRNRFVVASQIQRRFSDTLRSDRTTRRHLVEMESLGLIDVAEARSAGPLFPKVFFVTKRGVQKVRDGLSISGKPGLLVTVGPLSHC